MVDPLRIPGLRREANEISARQLRPPQVRLPEGNQPSFKQILAEAVSEVQRLQSEADITIKKLVAGEIKDVSEAMVAVEKADISFRTLMTVRSKVMTAYEEIMRMQV